MSAHRSDSKCLVCGADADGFRCGDCRNKTIIEPPKDNIGTILRCGFVAAAVLVFGLYSVDVYIANHQPNPHRRISFAGGNHFPVTVTGRIR